jgi:hypothetical protein
LWETGNFSNKVGDEINLAERVGGRGASFSRQEHSAHILSKDFELLREDFPHTMFDTFTKICIWNKE